jgi:nitrogen fixation/metabolism regulation signal transduction histidine kinase
LPFSFNKCNCLPLVIDNEFHVNNEALLAEYVGRIVLGHFAHIKRIIKTLSTTIPIANNSDIQAAIDRLKKDGKSSVDIEKRDGWVFQIISWLALFSENNSILLRDYGKGIAKDILARIADNKMVPQTDKAVSGSTGLGLYLIKNLLQDTDVKMTIQNADGRGTIVAIG